jgi:hypothetical protein
MMAVASGRLGHLGDQRLRVTEHEMQDRNRAIELALDELCLYTHAFAGALYDRATGRGLAAHEQCAGVARLPALQDAVPVRRYERKTPGELLHMDTKKLHRFDKPGHRVTGDRTQNTPRAGAQALHVAIDDHCRVGFSLLLVDEKASSACAFLLAALRYYTALACGCKA